MSHVEGKTAVSRTIVFVGPSLPRARARELASSAEIRRPIRRGDLDDIDAPALVAIIDGIFDSAHAVSPREIRTAIARGVKVVGAASMGALRAAEVPQMLGVGRVYEMYRDGTIDRDDEVAVLLHPDSSRCLTEPLVNVRFAVENLTRGGGLDPEEGRHIVATAARLHFSERVYRNILHEAGYAPSPEVDVLIAALRTSDLKREDAQTLLEELPRLADSDHWKNVASTTEPRHEYEDGFAEACARDVGAADASVLVWEYGDVLTFDELVRFVALGGRLEKPLRDALAKPASPRGHDADGGCDLLVPTVQELFEDVMSEWGWGASEEVHVTLNDLGIGASELEATLRNERRRKTDCIRALRARDEDIMRALRVELLRFDLTLKREAMRLGSLKTLAARASTELTTPEELDDAWRALLCEQPELTREGLLEASGLRRNEADDLVELVAKARRVGIACAATMERATAGRGVATSSGVTELAEVVRTTGATGRSMKDAEALAIARRIAETIGVTRIAQVGELVPFGLHVTSVYRPSNWSSTIGSGKSDTPEGAVIGGVMEELEKYCQERFRPDVVRTASYAALLGEGHKSVVDPRTLSLPYDSAYTDDRVFDWSSVRELAGGGTTLVPAAAITSTRTAHDIFFSARAGRKVFSSNGLASGMSLAEALLHALCECIERHANKLSEQDISNPGGARAHRWPDFAFVDLASCPEATRHLVAKIRDAGYETRVLDIVTDVGVPTFAARVFRTTQLHGLDEQFCVGSCSHPNPEIAIQRAILEAVQTRIGRSSGAREDMGLKPRSLGRHERPRPSSRGDAYWIRPYVPKIPFGAFRGCVGESVKADIDFVVRALTTAGFDRVLWTDLSSPDVPIAKALRVLIPGMEDTNPFHTGLRARARIVRDLMHRHEW
jgi:ribosomal protein S12 methylthiotransferase accessory factor